MIPAIVVVNLSDQVSVGLLLSFVSHEILLNWAEYESQCVLVEVAGFDMKSLQEESNQMSPKLVRIRQQKLFHYLC